MQETQDYGGVIYTLHGGRRGGFPQAPFTYALAPNGVICRECNELARQVVGL